VTAPTTTLILLRQAIAKKLYSPITPVVSETTGAGDAGYLTDSALTAADVTENLAGSWLMIVEAGGGAANGEIRRCYSADFAPGTTANMLVTPAWTGAPGNGISYEIHRWFHPTYMLNKINEILQSMKHEVLLSVTMCHDGNMEGADECTNACKSPGCGDGVLQALEECVYVEYRVKPFDPSAPDTYPAAEFPRQFGRHPEW